MSAARPRRDPRAEHARQVVAALSGRVLLDRAPRSATQPERKRKDPRAARAAALCPGRGRPRYMLAADGRRSRLPIAREQPEPSPRAPPIRRIESPAYWILVVLTGRRLGGAERRLIGAARVLADGSGGGVAVLSAAAPTELGPAGADRVLGFPADLAETFAPERLASCVAATLERLGPRHVLLDEGSADAADLARRLAAASAERFVPAVRRLGREQVGRRSACGTRELLTAPTRIMTVAPEAGTPYRGDPCEGRILEPVMARADERVTCLGALPMDPDSVPLAEAELILAGGNGVTDWESFDQLARALGAAKGGSRVVCDAGHLSRDRQIGASGIIVRPKLYLALGISGAPQHLQGIVEAEHVVAINADPQAPIMRRADLAIVADVRAVVPALLALLQHRGERSAGDGA